MESILKFLKYFWQNFLVSLLDILIVTFIVYKLLILLKRTRAIQVLKGLVILVFATMLASVLHLEALSWIFRGFWIVGVIAIVVVFQPELRNILAQIGGGRLSRVFFKGEEVSIDPLISGIEGMLGKRLGGLIVIERDTGLKNYIDTGTNINAELSGEILVSIVTPPGPLHDGAVIISGGRIAAAGCVLPLTQKMGVSKGLGTRHLAAIGITEMSDAWAIVVSEETSSISMAKEGWLESGIGLAELRNKLIDMQKVKLALKQAFYTEHKNEKRD